MEKTYVIPESLVAALLKYLSLGRPLEVAKLIVDLAELQEVTLTDGNSSGSD